MAKNIELLLLESVENLGLVGDVVKVKPGYARNYLLPHGVAVPPSASKVEALKEDRTRAHAELAALRAEREKLVELMAEVSVTLERSCNDQGALYGSVTHRDISDALIESGWSVDVRSVRLAHPIRRIGVYPVPIQFDKDLRAEVTVIVQSDRELEGYTLTGETVETVEAETTDEHDDDDRGHRRRHHDDDDDGPRGRRDRGERRERGDRRDRRDRSKR
ncbi:MAG: 50S ribosomal protein L9 [Planctomycetota bacterium]|jgi:large subunit ribosomal protein L9